MLPWIVIGFGAYVVVGFISFINNENIDDLPLATGPLIPTNYPFLIFNYISFNTGLISISS